MVIPHISIVIFHFLGGGVCTDDAYDSPEVVVPQASAWKEDLEMGGVRSFGRSPGERMEGDVIMTVGSVGTHV